MSTPQNPAASHVTSLRKKHSEEDLATGGLAPYTGTEANDTAADTSHTNGLALDSVALDANPPNAPPSAADEVQWAQAEAAGIGAGASGIGLGGGAAGALMGEMAVGVASSADALGASTVGDAAGSAAAGMGTAPAIGTTGLVVGAGALGVAAAAASSGNGNAGGNNDTGGGGGGADTTAPVVTASQSFSYVENRSAEAVIGTVLATDNVGVTQFRFENAGGTAGTTSTDGYYRIDSDGKIYITAAGVAAGVAQNDFETGANSFTYAVQAGDAAGNWSAAVGVTLNVTNDTSDDGGGGNFISVSGIEKTAQGGTFSGVWLDADKDGIFDLGETELTIGVDGKLSNGATLINFDGSWEVYFWDLIGPVVNLTGFGSDDEIKIDLKTHTNWAAHIFAGIDLDDWFVGAAPFQPTVANTGNVGGFPTAYFYMSTPNSWAIDIRLRVNGELYYSFTDWGANPSKLNAKVFATNLSTNNYEFIMPDLPV